MQHICDVACARGVSPQMGVLVAAFLTLERLDVEVLGCNTKDKDYKACTFPVAPLWGSRDGLDFGQNLDR